MTGANINLGYAISEQTLNTAADKALFANLYKAFRHLNRKVPQPRSETGG
jgi:hypothetical protein